VILSFRVFAEETGILEVLKLRRVGLEQELLSFLLNIGEREAADPAV
jgi:hypothetical protein